MLGRCCEALIVEDLGDITWTQMDMCQDDRVVQLEAVADGVKEIIVDIELKNRVLPTPSHELVNWGPLLQPRASRVAAKMIGSAAPK